MGSLVIAVITYIRAFFVTRHRLALEAAALRQQLAVFKRKQPRPRLSRVDRLFWTTCGAYIPGGLMLSSLSNRKPLCPGIVPASVCFGGGGLGNLGDRR